MLSRLLLSLAFTAAMFSVAAAQERQWSLDKGDDNAYLVFGVPDSDDVGFSMWCKVRSGEIEIFLPETDPALAPDQTISFKMAAGDATGEFKGKTSANEMSDTISLEAKLSDNDPIFAGLLEADRFRVKVGAEEIVIPLFDADIAGLLALCAKP